MKPENYFLRYALPCAHIIRDLKEIDEKELEELEDIAIHNRPISKKKLKTIFHRAFEKMERYSKKFDIETIRTYFHTIHNLEIDKKEGYYKTCGEMQRELSKVEVAKVAEKKGDLLVVKYDNKKRSVFSKLVSDAKVGEKVYIHFFYAVEKVKPLTVFCSNL